MKLWCRWSVNYDADKMIDELGELFRRLGLDPQGTDRTLVREATALAAKKIVAKGFNTIVMNVRPDDNRASSPRRTRDHHRISTCELGLAGHFLQEQALRASRCHIIRAEKRSGTTTEGGKSSGPSWISCARATC
jgi:hypothetical protein